uniref:HMA domain-containing protein n=1 Tax=Lactuca sativa TaxID=4236 RepID=A0A9R1XFK4_LACSA|nr:hypothetical protein LSAT_V11C500244100 [Lactuca sativa]
MVMFKILSRILHAMSTESLIQIWLWFGDTGVKKVEINRKQQKVTVSGYVEANKVLKKAKSTGKKSEIWPYVPYNLVAQPYAAQVYDKKAPPGYVRKVDTTGSVGVTRYEDPSYSYITLFSDDNPNACSVM